MERNKKKSYLIGTRRRENDLWLRDSGTLTIFRTFSYNVFAKSENPN